MASHVHDAASHDLLHCFITTPTVFASLGTNTNLQVSTCSSGPDPQYNLAPFSYFNLMSHSPAIIAIGITRSDNKSRAYGKKDTLANIEETGQLVVNSMNKWCDMAGCVCKTRRTSQLTTHNSRITGGWKQQTIVLWTSLPTSASLILQNSQSLPPPALPRLASPKQRCSWNALFDTYTLPPTR